jgi:spore maturation protein CgeB
LKILRITTIYKQYLDSFYAKHPGMDKKSYEEQKAALLYDSFGGSDFWSQALKSYGYDCMEIIANAESMQRAWLKTMAPNFSEYNWLLEIASLQILEFKPDILFVDDYINFTPEWIQGIRSLCRSIKLVFGWCGAPYPDIKIFKAYDFVLSCIPEMVEEFKNAGLKSFHLNHAFEPKILERVNNSLDKTIDFSFIGQIVMENNYHLKRAELLKKLSRRTPLKIFSNYKKQGPIRRAKNFVKKIVFKKTVPYFITISNIQSPVFGLEMFRTLAQSRLTLNCHIDVSPRSASNMRLFEATGMGTCLVTDWKENLKSLFGDNEIVTYKSSGECIEKVKWLLNNPEQIKAISGAGQQRTLGSHTFSDRVPQLDYLIKSFFRSKK